MPATSLIVSTNETMLFREKSNEIVLSILWSFGLAAFFLFAGWLSDDQRDWMPIVSLCFSVIFAALGSISIVKLLRKNYRTMILAPEGFKDSDIAPEFIPWSAIENISVRPIYFRGRHKSSVLEVQLTGESWSKIDLTRSGKIVKAQMGGLWIQGFGGTEQFDHFRGAFEAYATAHGTKIQ